MKAIHNNKPCVFTKELAAVNIVKPKNESNSQLRPGNYQLCIAAVNIVKPKNESNSQHTRIS